MHANEDEGAWTVLLVQNGPKDSELSLQSDHAGVLGGRER